MRTAFHWILECVGIGVSIFIIPTVVIYLFLFAANKSDNLLGHLVITWTNRPVPFLSLSVVLTICGLAGASVRTKWGWKVLHPLIKRILILKLIIYGARSGTVKRALRSRDKDAPNIIMGPYYRQGGPWPFVILRIVKTSDPLDPIIWGVFLDFPFLFKPYTVSVKDTVFVDMTFDEGMLFAFSGGGIGAEVGAKEPRKILLMDYLKDERFIKFMEATT